MKEQLVEFETAKLAKDKGFDESVIDWWEENNDGSWREEYPPSYDFGYGKYNKYEYRVSRPTQSLLQKWLWKEHSIWSDCKPLFSSNEQIGVHLTITSWKFPIKVIEEDDQFDIYKGLEKVLFETLKLI